MDFSKFLSEGSIASIGDNQFVVGWGLKTYAPLPFTHVPFQFFLSDFFLTNPKPWFICQNMRICTSDELLFSAKCLQIQWQEEKKYKQLYHSLMEAIQKSSLVKGVPYTFFWGTLDIDPEKKVESLLAAACSAYTGNLYGTWTPFWGMIGVSPEKLFQQKGVDVQVDCCAGTFLQREGAISSHYQKEHAFVVNGVQEALSPFGRCSVSQTKEQKHSHFSHLFTQVHIHLEKKTGIERLIHVLHPTAAIGAYPKKEGNNWLRQADQISPRGYYGAPFGVYRQPEEEASFYPAIRGVTWKKDQMRVGVGGGVIEKSVYANERKEILMKFAAIRKDLSL